MAFEDLVHVLDQNRIAAIVTRRADGTRVATPVAAMVVDSVPYLRSGFGSSSWWYRRAVSGRDVEFLLADGIVAERDRSAALALQAEPVRLERVAVDDPIQRAVDAVLEAKYSDEPGSIATMESRAAKECTLRVVAP